jgi:propionate catabolism operon transcriptional regulator
MAKKFAISDDGIAIYGETGSGKELLSQSIHNHSHRAGQAFVAVNCSAISENLLESELFGYDEGAFTGAKKGGKPGYFEIAHKGTIFLDEIGN